jgi:hypothetical protein
LIRTLLIRNQPLIRNQQRKQCDKLDLVSAVKQAQQQLLLPLIHDTRHQPASAGTSSVAMATHNQQLLPSNPLAFPPPHQLSSPQLEAILSTAAAVLENPSQAHRPCVFQFRQTILDLAEKQQQEEDAQLLDSRMQQVKDIVSMEAIFSQQDQQQKQKQVKGSKKAPAAGSTKRRGTNPANNNRGGNSSKNSSKRTKHEPGTPHACATILIEGAKELQAQLRAAAAARGELGEETAA